MDWLTLNWDKVITIFFAGLSAVFAGLSFVVLFLDYRRNNPRISVNISRAILSSPSATVHCLNGTIVNKGRRPILLTRITFLMSNGEHLHFLPGSPAFVEGFPNFPVTLGEMESFNVVIYADALIEAKNDQQLGLRAICFHDTVDNIYQKKLKRKTWKELYSF